MNINEPVSLIDKQEAFFKIDSIFTYQIEFADEDFSENYHFSSLNLPSWLSLNPQTGLLTGQPKIDDAGSLVIEIKVEDSGGFPERGSAYLYHIDGYVPIIWKGKSGNKLTDVSGIDRIFWVFSR